MPRGRKPIPPDRLPSSGMNDPVGGRQTQHTRMPTDKEIDTIAKKAAKLSIRELQMPLIAVDMALDPKDETREQCISRHIRQALRWYNKPLVKNDDEVAERFDEYFATCATTGELATVEGLALSLGTVRSTMNEWEAGQLGPARAAMIKKAKEIIAQLDAGLVSENKLPQVTYIFRAKNFYQMADKQEVVLTPNTGMETASEAELERKYLEAMPDEE